MSRTATRPRPPEALPYRIELSDANAGTKRILARAMTAQLARAIFRAATGEHPESRITLRRGARIIADSGAEQSSQAPRAKAD
jgi:hypothetical protein